MTPPALSRQQRRAVARLHDGKTHPKVLKEAQDAGAKAFENKKPNDGHLSEGAREFHRNSPDFWFQSEMAREGAVYRHIVRGASQRRLDAPRPKLSLDPPSTIVNIDRGTIASRRGGEFARRRHHAEQQHEMNKVMEAVEHAEARLPGTQGRLRDHQPHMSAITDRTQSKARKFPHNQRKMFTGGGGESIGRAENLSISKAVSRHIDRIPNTVPLVRTPYGSDRVGGRGIPRDLGPSIDKSMGGYWLGLVGAVGVAGVAEAINNSRKRGIGRGRYASSAASSLPPYGGRR
jgi:hypothetical protein